MRPLLALLVALAALAGAQAAELRFPPSGPHAFHLTLPKTWHSKTDARGGLLLIPPATQQHTMLYLAMLTDASLRAQDDGNAAAQLAQQAAKTAGIALNDKRDPARVTGTKGATIYRGTAFYGRLPAKRGLARTAKIIIIRMAPDTWAQVLVVTQPGMNAVEIVALDQVLNSITLGSE